MSNANLKTAKKSKNDEFYTLMEDIEKELRYYTESFEGKVVYCNCDDYQQSNFYKYFYYNFHYLKLKKLICTCFNADNNGLYAIYDGEIETTGKLNGDGDFRSEECIEYLKQADVVVTNPPFSLFRQYVKQLMDYGKKFIIIGNMNAITYKEIFPYIKSNQLWMGCSLNGTKCSFGVPETYNGNNVYIDNGKRMGKVNNACWFTNIENKRCNEKLDLYKRYSFEDYPKYDNYLGFNVDKVADIPMDDFIDIEIPDEEYEKWKKVYGDDLVILETFLINGLIMKIRIKNPIWGVPITFLYKYNPTQFEIIKFRKGDDDKDLSVNGKTPYFRILIKKLS